MKSRVYNAIENHKKGYNCCQAVVCTYADLVGIDDKIAFKMSEIFGVGVAEVCGSVCAMMLIASLKNSDGELENSKSKVETYKLGRMLSDKFKEMNTSIICKELRGEVGKEKLRSCRGCVTDAAILIEKYIFPGEFEEYIEEN